MSGAKKRSSANTTACLRLRNDYKAILSDPIPYIEAAPKPENILHCHYVIKGPENSPYKGGYYHGKLVFPNEYPFKPPSIYMTTPNGRFRCNTRLCLSITDYHPDTWNPAWSISTILTGFLSFMLEKRRTAGSVDTSSEEKQKLAYESLAFNLKDADFCDLFPELRTEIVKKLRERQGSGDHVLPVITTPSLKEIDRRHPPNNGPAMEMLEERGALATLAHCSSTLMTGYLQFGKGNGAKNVKGSANAKGDSRVSSEKTPHSQKQTDAEAKPVNGDITPNTSTASTNIAEQNQATSSDPTPDSIPHTKNPVIADNSSPIKHKSTTNENPKPNSNSSAVQNPQTTHDSTTNNSPATSNSPTTTNTPTMSTTPTLSNSPTMSNNSMTNNTPTTTNTPATSSSPTTNSSPATNSNPSRIRRLSSIRKVFSRLHSNSTRKGKSGA